MICCLVCQTREAGPRDDLSQVMDPEDVSDQDLKLVLQLPGSVADCSLEGRAATSVPRDEGTVQEVVSTASYIHETPTLNCLRNQF